MNGDEPQTPKMFPTRVRAVGTIERRGSFWVLSCDPHVNVFLKRVFIRIDKASDTEIRIRSTPEVDRDLEWCRDRFVLDMEHKDELLLHQGAETMRRRERVAAQVDAGTYVPRAFEEMAVPPRDYQRVAADLTLLNGSLLLGDDVGLGKAQPLDAKVLTPYGWAMMGTLRVGDDVVDPDGGVGKVEGVFPQGRLQVYRVETPDGGSTECCDDHLWTVQTPNDRMRNAWRTMPLAKMRGGLHRYSGAQRSSQYFLPLPQPVRYEDPSERPLDPYLLGVLLGDGGMSQAAVTITKGDTWLINKAADALPSGVELRRDGDTPTWRVARTAISGSNPVTVALRALGLMGKTSPEKAVPRCYMRAPVAARIALLAGLMDTDGDATVGGVCIFNTSSPQLRDDVMEIVRSLGGVASVSTKSKPTYPYKGKVRIGLPAHRVNVRLSFNPFTLPRKAERWRPPYMTRAIQSVEPTRVVECQCIRVSTRRNLYITDDFIVTHNTASAITVLSVPRTLPAVVLTVTALPRQWQAQCAMFLPSLRTHVIEGTKPYDIVERCIRLSERDRREAARNGDPIPPAWTGGLPDVLILPYGSRLVGWMDVLKTRCKTLVLDECQDLRHAGTDKYKAATVLRSHADYCIGLSATPVANFSAEYFSVLEVVRPGCLGTRAEFLREFCVNADQERKARIADPRAFGLMLRTSGMMLRRTRKDVGRELPPLTVIPTTIDSDPLTLDKVKHRVSELAKTIMRLNGGDVMTRSALRDASGEMSRVLRQATGISKAVAIAAFIRMLVETGEPVLCFCWHREVYAILKAELAGDPEKGIEDLHPGWHTGSETEKQKRDAIVAFTTGKTKVLVMSLRSGAGIDGLQHICKTVVIGELDWSPAVHTQAIGRIARDGQAHPVFAYYLLAEDGSDPVVADTCGAKTASSEPVRNPDAANADPVEVDPDHVKVLAKRWLETHREP